MSGKDRRLALLELAKRRGAKGTGSSSSTTEPIAAPPLSVAPAEGPEQGKKRKRLVKASTSSAAAAATAAAVVSTEEESSGSPLIHRQRKKPAVEGASSLQPGEIEVVEIEEGSSPPLCAQPASDPTNLPSPRQQLPPTTKLPSSPLAGLPLLSALNLPQIPPTFLLQASSCLQLPNCHLPPQQGNHLVHPLILLGALLPKLGVHHHHCCQSLPPLLNVVGLARAQALLEPPMRISAGSSPWFDSS